MKRLLQFPIPANTRFVYENIENFFCEPSLDAEALELCKAETAAALGVMKSECLHEEAGHKDVLRESVQTLRFTEDELTKMGLNLTDDVIKPELDGAYKYQLNARNVQRFIDISYRVGQDLTKSEIEFISAINAKL